MTMIASAIIKNANIRKDRDRKYTPTMNTESGWHFPCVVCQKKIIRKDEKDKVKFSWAIKTNELFMKILLFEIGTTKSFDVVG
jgi:hypothetical protein